MEEKPLVPVSSSSSSANEDGSGTVAETGKEEEPAQKRARTLPVFLQGSRIRDELGVDGRVAAGGVSSETGTTC